MVRPSGIAKRAATAARGELSSATIAGGARRAAPSISASRALVIRSMKAKPGSEPMLTRPKLPSFSPRGSHTNPMPTSWFTTRLASFERPRFEQERQGGGVAHPLAGGQRQRRRAGPGCARVRAPMGPRSVHAAMIPRACRPRRGERSRAAGAVNGLLPKIHRGRRAVVRCPRAAVRTCVRNPD